MTNYLEFEEILSLVDKPSRYLGREINTVKKDPSTVDLRVALAFPDLYEIGTSHFGLQILYHILNQNEKIYAERVYAPAKDMAELSKKNNLPLASLETRTPLSKFKIIGFSLLYELNFTNVLMMMDLSGIPFYSFERDLSYPIVIAGGPCTSNPEPMADFFDAMVIGDGEAVLEKMCRVYLEWEGLKTRNKKALLKAWSEIQGVYIPSFFYPDDDENGLQFLTPEFPEYTKIKRAIVPDLDSASFPVSPVLPSSRPVHDRLRLEVARGCSRGCRFCQAGMIYRPVRERSMEVLSKIAEESLAATGYEDLSLLSLSTGDYSCIVPLMERLIDKQRSHPLAVSLPSLRAETLTPKLMNLIKRVRKTGFTIAPEAGTQRLRDVINKNISEKDIIDTVSDALNLGWNGIKLYFMIGLPTETDQDIDGIVDLVKKLRRIKPINQRSYQITVSVATFIPKPHTPFQWASQLSRTEAKEKIFRLKEKLNLSRVHFKWQNPEVSILEGLWARGDRRLAPLLSAAYHNGCQFDGWSDQFRFDLWNQSIVETGISIQEFTTRQRNINEPLPWDHIDIGLTRDFLIAESEKATKGQFTPDCRWGECSGCGVCDFSQILPRIRKNEYTDASVNNEIEKEKNTNLKKLRVTYSKINQARFLGHLELVNVFIRAIRRTGIFVKYSEGYHPKPKISFDNPLPVGMESLEESFVFTTLDSVKPHDVFAALKDGLPEGIIIKNCEVASAGGTSNKTKPLGYLVSLRNGCFDEKDLKKFLKAKTLPVTRKNKKGKKISLDLKSAVSHISLVTPQKMELCLVPQEGKTLRPNDFLSSVFGIKGDRLKMVRIVKS